MRKDQALITNTAHEGKLDNFIFNLTRIITYKKMGSVIKRIKIILLCILTNVG